MLNYKEPQRSRKPPPQNDQQVCIPQLPYHMSLGPRFPEHSLCPKTVHSYGVRKSFAFLSWHLPRCLLIGSQNISSFLGFSNSGRQWWHFCWLISPGLSVAASQASSLYWEWHTAWASDRWNAMGITQSTFSDHYRLPRRSSIQSFLFLLLIEHSLINILAILSNSKNCFYSVQNN